MAALTLDVAGHDRTWNDPARARADARRYLRQARELDTPQAPAQAREKARELRQRAKALQDWARTQEDRTTPAEGSVPAHKETPPAPRDERPRGQQARPERTHPGRAAARRALHESGVRVHTTGRQLRRGVRRYQKAGGPTIGAGNLIVFLIGGAIGVLLLEDVLSARGSTGLAGALHTTETVATKVIAPVPIITAGATAEPAPATPAPATSTSSQVKAGPSPVQPIRP